MRTLIQVLSKVGKETKVHTTSDGTRLLILPYGGRVLGLFPTKSGKNFYWTHPALNSAKTAREFYAGNQWHNSGGDRVWLAPETDLFFPNFPKLDSYLVQPALDPGQYRLVKTKRDFRLENRMVVNLSRSKKKHVDVPWNDPDYSGFAVQACNVNSQLGAFSELECHAPAIGGGTGRWRCTDEAQVWAFRGTQREIAQVAKTLLTPRFKQPKAAADRRRA